MTTTAILKVKNMSKFFYNENSDKITALSDVSIECFEGEFICIIGPTGCGKTTLLRAIAGLEKPDQGSIEMYGKTVNSINKDATLVFQQYSLFPWLNLIDNVAFGLEMRGITKKNRYRRVQELLEMVGLKGFEKSFPYELSGGMQQRAAIARALAHDPKVLLLDEPFGALDDRTRHRLQEELLEIWKKQKKTVLMITHNIDEAIFLSTRILIMKDRPGCIGKIIDNNHDNRDRTSEWFAEMHSEIRKTLEHYLS